MIFDWHLKPEKLSPHFFKALVKWQADGHRAVQIEIDSVEPRMAIWCFDYTVMEGRYVTKITDIPTTKQLAKAKQASIEKQRIELQKKMEELR